MLRELTIRNVAVIYGVTVGFVPGLNVLTGETGAGKSILIDALQLVLGARGSDDLLRSGADEAVVEAAFDLAGDSRVADLLHEEGIAAEPGEFLLLRRHLFRDGKSKAYANGRLTSAATLRGLAQELVDIHGQHPSQPLLDPRRHREVLDAYAGVSEDTRTYRLAYGRWQDLREEREGLLLAERERAQRLDLLEFQRREIESARLEPDEEEALLAERAILANHERLFSAVGQAYAALEESEEAILGRLRAATIRVQEAAAIDRRLQDALDALETAGLHLQEAARGLRDYRGRIEFDPERLEAIETRLHEIGKLKRKYGAGVREVLEHLERVRGDLLSLEQSAARRGDLDRVIDVSFISLALVLPTVIRLLVSPAEAIALVKPQFEVGKGQVGKRGVVRDPALHRAVLERVAGFARELGFAVSGMTASPLLGPMGNREFLVHLTTQGVAADVTELIARAMAPALA